MTASLCNYRSVRAVFGLVAALALCTVGSAQSVTGVRAEIVNTADALITYNLDDTLPEPLRVDLYYSHDGGTTFRPASGALTGDFGSGVFKGAGKAITWRNFAVDVASLGGRQVTFRVLARREATVYVVQFQDDGSTATEGQGNYLARVKVSLPFTGTVKYQIYKMSNVIYGQPAGNDINPLPGTLQFNNSTEAIIPITILDDLIEEDAKALIIDLEFDQMLGYSLGPKFRHSVVLYDNDGMWSGMLKTAETESGFSMKILQQGSTVEASIVKPSTNAKQAGAFPVPPGAGWPLGVTSFTDSSVDMASAPIPFGTQGTHLFPGIPFTRLIQFQAKPGATGDFIHRNLVIGGTFTDQISSSDASSKYLDTQTSGVFLLIRQQSPFRGPDVPLFPYPASGNSTAGGAQ